MKKNWSIPEVEELSIKATANGAKPQEEFDSEWVQDCKGKWVKLGASA